MCRKTGIAWAWFLPFSAYQSAVLGYHQLTKYNKNLTQNHGAMRNEYQERADGFDIRPRDC